MNDDLIYYVIMAVIAAIIGYFGINSDYFIFRAVGAIIVAILIFYGGIFIGVIVEKIVEKYLTVFKKIKFMITVIITGVILAPLAHWGLFNHDFLFKVLGFYIIVMYIMFLYLWRDLFLNTPKEKTESNKSKQTAQPKPVSQSEQTTQPKPVVQSKQVTSKEYWSIIESYVMAHKYDVLSEEYICQIHQATLRDTSKIEVDLKKAIELLKNNFNKQTPQTKPARKAKQTTRQKPATSKILNENDLFNCVKAIPIRFDFNYPQMKENPKLNELCNILLSGDMISQVLDAGNIESLERNLQVKRLRSTNQEDYNRSLENNILFELYKYSNLMSIFKVLEDRKNDKVKVDYQKLWEMIQIECKTRIQNLSVEKKSNPAIHNLLQRYDYDTRKFKMVINDYIDVRENDYILSGMMSSILYIAMNSVFFGEINNQPVLQMIKSYSSKEIMCMLEALIINTATLRLTTYANGGSMFERD